MKAVSSTCSSACWSLNGKVNAKIKKAVFNEDMMKGRANQVENNGNAK